MKVSIKFMGNNGPHMSGEVDVEEVMRVARGQQERLETRIGCDDYNLHPGKGPPTTPGHEHHNGTMIITRVRT